MEKTRTNTSESPIIVFLDNRITLGFSCPILLHFDIYTVFLNGVRNTKIDLCSTPLLHFLLDIS